MKNLLIFCAILSVSTFAGNRKIRQLEPISNENPDFHKLLLLQSEGITHSVPTKKPDRQKLDTKIKQSESFDQHGRKISVVLELSPEKEIEAIHFKIHKGYDMKSEKKRIPLKNLFQKTFDSPQIYEKTTSQQIFAISFHPLDFNPRDGGTFAIRYKNRYFFTAFSAFKEVVMTLVKDEGKWVLADEEGRLIKTLWIKIRSLSPRIVSKIVADWGTSAKRKLKIRSCKESARALL